MNAKVLLLLTVLTWACGQARGGVMCEEWSGPSLQSVEAAEPTSAPAFVDLSEQSLSGEAALAASLELTADTECAPLDFGEHSEPVVLPQSAALLDPIPIELLKVPIPTPFN